MMNKKNKIYCSYLLDQSEFSHQFSTWAKNHNGWSKMKKLNKRRAKRKEKQDWKKEIKNFND